MVVVGARARVTSKGGGLRGETGRERFVVSSKREGRRVSEIGKSTPIRVRRIQ